MRSLCRAVAVSILPCLSIVACSSKEDSTSKPAAKRPAPPHLNASLDLTAMKGGSNAPAGKSSQVPEVDPHIGALGFIPRDAYFVLHAPSIGALIDGVADSELADALTKSGIVDVKAKTKELLARGHDFLGTAEATAVPIFDLLTSVRGEFLLAVLSVDPAAVAAGARQPVTAAVFVDVGDRAAELAKAIDDVGGAKPNGVTVERLDAGHYRLFDAEMQVELAVKDHWFAAMLAPGGRVVSKLDDLFATDRELSFANGETMHLAIGSDAPTNPARVEGFVNLAPLWQFAKVAAPSEALQAMETFKIDSLRGAYLSLAFDGPLVHDQVSLISPGRHDVLTTLFDARPFDPAFARFAPPDAEDASVSGFDVERAWRTIRDRIPRDARAQLDAALERVVIDEGVDIEKDVLGTFGPNFLVATRGSWVPDENGDSDFEAVFAIEVRSATRANKLFDQVRERIPLPLKPRTIADAKAFTVMLPFPEAPPWLELSFALRDDALVIATSSKALEKSLVAAATSGSKCPRLAAAIAAKPADSFSVAIVATGAAIANTWGAILGQARTELDAQGLSAEFPAEMPKTEQIRKFAGMLSDSVRYWRATDRGLTLDSRGPVSAPAIAMFALSTVSSIAIPKLLETRIDANEAAAIATLRMMMSAEAQFESSGCADRDKDGIGEYGSLAEMAGMALLPSGEWLEPPILSKKCGILVDGCLQKSGYNFRCFLPDRNGVAIAERPEGGAPPEVEANHSEVQFAICAWPIEPGSTGNRAFYITQLGVIRATTFESISHARRGPVDVFVTDVLWPKHEPADEQPVKGTQGELWTSLEQ